MAADDDSVFGRKVGADAARKLRAQRDDRKGVWFGLGMSGLIGWSVAAPTLAGVLIGLWIDRRWPGGHPWTLALLVAGLVIGCANAWRWLAEQEEAMRNDVSDGK
jgi:ATP synthase protein I